MPLKLKQKGGGEICPPGFICLQSVHLMIIVGISVVILLFYLFPVEVNVNRRHSRPKPTKKVEIEVDDDDDRQIVIKKKSEPLNRDQVIVHHGYQTPRQMIVSKEHDRLINPLLPPERSYVANNYGVPINIPTRGYTGGFQQVGIMYKKGVTDPTAAPGNNNETNILPLFGRPTQTNRDKWHYYTASDKYHSVKIPITHKDRECNSEYGCNELYDKDVVSVPPYNGEFEVQIYGYDSPRYLPHMI